MPNQVVVRTLLLTDVVDSTRLTRELGDERTAEVFARIDRLARDLLVEHGGQEIDKTDGFLHLFERAIDAVRYAVALHAGMESLSAEIGTEVAMRAGIHTGEVVLRENTASDISLGAKPVELDGLAKPLAARIMALGGGGQTLLSRAAYDLAERASVGRPDADSLRWKSHGTYRAKGLDAAHEVWEVVVGGQPFQAPPRSAPATAAAGRRLGAAAAVAGGLMLAAVVTAYVVFSSPSMSGPAVQWFENAEHLDGILQGATPAPGPEGRRFTWRQTSVDGRVVAMDIVNERGNLVPLDRHSKILSEPGPREDVTLEGVDAEIATVGWAEREVTRLEYEYGEDGRASAIYQRDANGRVVRRATLRWSETGVVRSWTNDFGVPVPNADGDATVEEMTLDEEGRPILTSYRYADGDRSSGSVGVHDIASTWDERGLPASRTTQDASGAPVRDMSRGGVVTIRFGFDDAGREIERRYEGFGGVPVISDNGCATLRMRYDGYGNLARVSCLDVDGDPTPVRGTGCPSLATSTAVDRIETRCESSPGQLQASQRGWATSVLSLDDNGYLERRERLDVDGSPVDSPAGIASSAFVSDSLGQLTESGPHADRQARPVVVAGGCAAWRARLQEGRELERTCLGGDGKPLINHMGWAVRTTSWDEADNPNRLAWFGPDGEAVVHRNAGHTLRQAFDDRGMVVRESSFDAAGEPLRVRGIHQRRYTYDGLGRRTSMSLFDDREHPISEPRHTEDEARFFGFHRLEEEFDDQRRTLTSRTIGPTGQLVVNDNGWAVRKRRYDDAGNQIETAYFDAQDRPTHSAMGVAAERFTYDARNRQVAVAFFDRDGKPVFSRPLGYSGVRVTYDDRDNEAAVEYLDPLGQLLAPELGYAVERNAYDEQGRRTRFRVFDGAGKPTLTGEGAWGVDFRFDAAGNEIERIALGLDGEPVPDGPIGRQEYDAAGRRISQSRHELDGRLFYSEGNGFAREETEVDALGRIVAQRYFDADGQPGTPAFPPAVHYTFHPTGNHLVRTEHRDADGKLVDGWGPAAEAAQHDLRGNVVAMAWRDAKGQPTAREDGTAELENTWDLERVLLLTQRRLAPDGGLLEHARFEYDTWGRLIRTTWQGADGKPVEGPQGCREMINTWGDHGILERGCDGDFL